MTTYEIGWLPSPEDRADDTAPFPAPLVVDREFVFAGRADELTRLVDGWTRAQEGERGLALSGSSPQRVPGSPRS